MTPAAKWKGWSATHLYLFPAGTCTHVHTRRDGPSARWTLMHEMNMSSVNFDWRFNAAAGFMENSVYRNELLTIKNIPFEPGGGKREELKQASTNHSTTHHIHLVLHKHKRNHTHTHMHSVTQTRCIWNQNVKTEQTLAQLLNERLFRDVFALKIHQTESGAPN